MLQEQELERVGDDATRKVDVRVVAATNRDLKREADEGRFRSDLYYRLSVFPIAVPPLRERREDVPELARHFLERCAERLKRAPATLTEEDAARLMAYDWPGNVRELQNVIERAAILAVDGTLSLEHALPQSSAAPPKTELDKATIEQALADASGNVSQAARTLGLSRQALYRRMKTFGLS